MRFFTTAVALFASLALAQQNAINIPSGQSTLDITAGQPQTITWTNPSSGTVTIKLQDSGPNITPGSGVTLGSAIPAADGTATFTIDPSQVSAGVLYTIEIIDDTNSSNYNFSPNFGISGATGSATGSLTGSATASMTSGSSSATGSTDSTASTDSTMSITSSASATDSTASSSETGSTTTDSSSASSSETTSSAAASETTSAPSSEGNAAAALKIQGSLVALVAVAVAVL